MTRSDGRGDDLSINAQTRTDVTHRATAPGHRVVLYAANTSKNCSRVKGSCIRSQSEQPRAGLVFPREPAVQRPFSQGQEAPNE